MNNPRRIFLSQISVMASATALSKPMASAAAITKHVNTLLSKQSAVTIYHTNDIKGIVGTAFKNKGGLKLIKAELKKQETGGLLLNAGNFINGSHSFNQQKETIAIMNGMGYHAAAIGSEELSGGQEQLAALAGLMRFPLLNCNYKLTAVLAGYIKPHTIITTGRFKVGITAVGNKADGVTYNDPVISANKVAAALKNDKKCDLVICLTHLDDTTENYKLAEGSENIDMIIGSNNNKLMINSRILHNKLKQEVILAQTGWHGLMIGRTVIGFDADKQKSGLDAKHIIPGQQAGQFSPAFTEISLAKPALV